MGHDAVDVVRREGEQGNPSSAFAEIVVPDSYPSFVRLLLFLYTGKKTKQYQLSLAERFAHLFVLNAWLCTRDRRVLPV